MRSDPDGLRRPLFVGPVSLPAVIQGDLPRVEQGTPSQRKHLETAILIGCHARSPLAVFPGLPRLAQ